MPADFARSRLPSGIPPLAVPDSGIHCCARTVVDPTALDFDLTRRPKRQVSCPDFGGPIEMGAPPSGLSLRVEDSRVADRIYCKAVPANSGTSRRPWPIGRGTVLLADGWHAFSGRRAEQSTRTFADVPWFLARSRRAVSMAPDEACLCFLFPSPLSPTATIQEPAHVERSTHCSRQEGGSNGCAKYCVSRATLPASNSMMLTVCTGRPS